MMNRYKLQYVLDVVSRDQDWVNRFDSARDVEDVLRWHDLYEVLLPAERRYVMGELAALAEAERFKELHRLGIGNGLRHLE